MKRLFNLAIAAVLALGAVSCAKEVVLNEGAGSDVAGGKKLVFSLPEVKTATTYAIASDSEMDLKMSDTKIFMFDDAGQLEAIIDQIIEGDDGTNTTATISVQSDWTGDKKFYFVGNISAGGKTLPVDPSLTPMSEADFVKEVTTSQAASHLKTPLLMTNDGAVVVGDIESAPAVVPGNVKMYRTVARFDIENNVTENGVTIEKVVVENANLQGYVFGYSYRPDFAVGTAKGDLPEVSVAAAVNEDDTDPASDMVQNEESLFYLYPTKIATNGSGTQMHLIGDVGGVKKKFTVKNEAADIAIEANKRYKISAIDANSLTFVLEVVDWDEADDELVGRPGTGSDKLDVVADPTGTAISSYNAAGNIIALETAGGDIEFTVKAMSSAGTSFTIVSDSDYADHSGNFTVTETANDVITYGAPYYESVYTISVSALEASETSFTTLVIKDKADPKATISIGFQHMGTGTEDMVLVNSTTFPDPVFRAYIETEFGITTGLVPQSKFDAVTHINMAGNTELKSVKGIENFKKLEYIRLDNTSITELNMSDEAADNLKYLYAVGSKLSGHLDVSNYTSLKTLHGHVTNLTSADVSGCTSLDWLAFRNNKNFTTIIGLEDCVSLRDIKLHTTSLSGAIDVSGFSKLETFHIHSCDLTSVDVSGCTSLDWLSVRENPNLTTLTGLGDCVALRDFKCTNTKLTSIDVSNCPLLTLLYANVTNISSIDVSNNKKLEDFDTQFTNITELDLTENIELKTLNTRFTNISQLDLSKNINLERLYLSQKVETINLENNTELVRLHIGHSFYEPLDCAIKSLDISNNKKLNHIEFNHCPKLNEVTVWSGFNVSNPEAHFTEQYLILGTTPKDIKYVVKP